MKNLKKKLRKLIPSTHAIENSREFKGLKSSFKASCYWSRDHQCIARGVAAGLASCVIPGFQFFYAAILVIILRGNAPVALLFTFVSNPLTVVPITYFIYRIGTYLIGKNGNNIVIHAFQWDFSSFHAFWFNIRIWILQFGKAFLVGLPIASLIFGLIGYFGSLLIWKTLTFYRK